MCDFVHMCLQRPEEGLGSPGTGVAGSSELVVGAGDQALVV